MSDVCEMYELREDMEYQPVCENSKNRVYVSLVRSDAERELRAKEAQRIRKEKEFVRKVIRVAAEGIKFLASAGSGLGVLHVLSAKMLEVRGYSAVSGEYLFAAVFAVVVWNLLDSITGGDYLDE